MKKKITVATILILTTLLTGCYDGPRFEKLFDTCKSEAFYFDTIVTFTFHGDTDKCSEIIDYADERCKYYDAIFNISNPSSDICKINASAGETVVVSDEMADLLKEALIISSKTAGAVDPTIGSVSFLWDFGSDNPSLPDGEDLAEGLKHIDFNNLTVTGNNVTVSDPLTGIDIGFIAKGYIADRLYADITNRFDDVSGIINLGGNVMVFGEYPVSGELFTVGIKNPSSETGKNCPVVLSIPDGYSVATAGSYERCFDLDGVHYHHILDVKTGQPVKTVLLSASVYGPSSTICDGLSTALFIMGADNGTKFLKENYPDYNAVFITNKNTVIYSNDLTSQ